MGCVNTRPMNSPPRGLQKLKTQNGYAKRGSNRIAGKNPGRVLRPEPRNSSDGYGSSGCGGGRDGKEGKVVTKEAERESGGGCGGGRDGKEGKVVTKEAERESGGGCGGGRDDKEGKVVTKEAERESGGGGGGSGGSVSKRSTSSKQSNEPEVVDGWPKWLTDNIPRDVLAGIVPKSAESYDKIDKVGQGTYSNVYKARDRDTGKIVALKKVRFDTSEPESVKFMAREIMILQKLDHPNIIKLEGLATSRMQYSLYLVFDYMLSDLSKIIARPDEYLTEPQIKCYMNQLLSGLQHCHDMGILHRDIKGSNLLIDKNGMLKIADFGLANYFMTQRKRPLTSRVVTLWYRAPELLLGATDYGVGIDLWSAGCLLAEMYAGRPIMPGRTEVEQLHRIFKLFGTPSEEYWKKLKVSTTFRPPQTYKPNFREAFRDFPPSSVGLLKILLSLDPTYRGSAGSALQNQFFSTSPLACDLSGLPVTKKEDDEPIQTNERRKHRHKSAKMKQRSKIQRERRKKDEDTEKPKGDYGSSKEEQESNAIESTLNTQDPTTTSGTTCAFSSVKPTKKEEISPPLFSPRLSSPQKMSPRSEAHPNASKNIKNLPPLPNSKINYNNGNHENRLYRFSQVHRSSSTREFRALDD